MTLSITALYAGILGLIVTAGIAVLLVSMNPSFASGKAAGTPNQLGTAAAAASAAAQASREFYRVRVEVEDALRHWREHGQPMDRLIPSGVQLAEAE